MNLTGLAALLACIGCGPQTPPGPPDMAAVDLRAEDDLTLAPLGCSTLQQNCSAPQQKCTIVQNKQGYSESCVDLLGSRTLGETCMRTGPGYDGVGHDNCQKGLNCSGLASVYLETPERHCRKFCSKNSDCTAKEACIRMMDSVGLCVPTCMPFGVDCSNGLNCSDAVVDITKKYVYLCREPGIDWIGEECIVGCVQNAACLLSQNGKSYCYRMCDPQHPCAMYSCTPLLGDPSQGTICQ